MPAISVVGMPSQTYCLMRLTSGTVSIADLRRRARTHLGVRPAAVFVMSEVRPDGGRQRTSGNATDGKLTYDQLIEMATEWDEAGHTTIAEFLDAVECELTGTDRSAVVCQTMSDLGFEAKYHRALEGVR